MNYFFSIILILFSLPISLIISLAIVIFDGFPIFFIQKRVGKNNKVFNMYKFRTMKNNTPDIATHLIDNEEIHLTASGKILRRLSLDEIPQLINILFGEMNFIGPRPALYNQYDLIEMRSKHKIETIKPGITGWAQVNGRDFISLEEKVKLDLFYFNNVNLRIKIKILFLTIFNTVNQKNIKN